MRDDQLPVHEHELPQASPDGHSLAGLQGLLLRQALLEKLEDIMLMGHKCLPCDAPQLSLDSKWNMRELVG